jgi:hypothetical protein
MPAEQCDHLRMAAEDSSQPFGTALPDRIDAGLVQHDRRVVEADESGGADRRCSKRLVEPLEGLVGQ